MPLPTAIYTTAQIRRLDDYAIEHLGVPGYTLMKRAAEGSLRLLRTRWPMAERICIVCGGGNNGGDGYVLARFARAAGLKVSVLAASDVARLKGDAERAYVDFRSGDGVVETFSSERLSDAEVLVDAVCGNGLTGELKSAVAVVVRAINGAGKPILSLDVPTGLHSDSGLPQGDAVRADCTITFVGLKTGLFLGDGPDYVGQLFFDDLEVTAPVSAEFVPVLTRCVEAEIPRALPRRARNSHKGRFGHVLIVGGGAGMPGAARLAGEAALRAGAGLVSVACQASSLVAISSGRPELMVHAVRTAADLRPLIERADVIAAGPGLGRSPWADELLASLLPVPQPLLLDADALNWLAEHPEVVRQRQGPWILTPHPGEAARLLGCSNTEIQSDRLAALGRLVERYQAVVTLKGAGSLIGGPQLPNSICERGNPGMATAGMGDVLTGVIAGLQAQLGIAGTAARIGVLVHAMAGDAAARGGERGLLASDLLRELRAWVNLQ